VKKAIRDELITELKARATADSVTVGETRAHLARDFARAAGTAILVLHPRSRGSIEVTNASVDEIAFPVACVAKGLSEEQVREDLGKLTSIVEDTVLAKSTLNGKAASVHVESTSDPELVEGLGSGVVAAVQIVVVQAVAMRT
jgi:hypothetical protein